MSTSEDKAREVIDEALEKADWKVLDYKSANLGAELLAITRWLAFRYQ